MWTASTACTASRPPRRTSGSSARASSEAATGTAFGSGSCGPARWPARPRSADRIADPKTRREVGARSGPHVRSFDECYGPVSTTMDAFVEVPLPEGFEQFTFTVLLFPDVMGGMLL